MGEEEKIIDQSALAESISEQIPYMMLDYFLVKPLDPIKVKKEISKPVTDKPETKDENGIAAVDFDKVEKEIVEVDSDYRKGVVIKVPRSYENMFNDEHYAGQYKIKVGDILVFREAGSRYFDLVKDTRLVKHFDIIAIEQ